MTSIFKVQFKTTSKSLESIWSQVTCATDPVTPPNTCSHRGKTSHNSAPSYLLFVLTEAGLQLRQLDLTGAAFGALLAKDHRHFGFGVKLQGEAVDDAAEVVVLSNIYKREAVEGAIVLLVHFTPVAWAAGLIGSSENGSSSLKVEGSTKEQLFLGRWGMQFTYKVQK